MVANGEEATAAVTAAAAAITLESELANAKASQKARCVMKLSLL